MGLFIKEIDTEWHFGEPIPIIRERVVTFQADGHELDLILAAMKRTTRPVIDVEPSPAVPHS